MLKANPADIKFYKGVILVKIHAKIVADGGVLSIDEVDEFLKYYADLSGSCANMTHEELQTLKEYSKQFATTIGLEIKDQEER